MQDTASPSPVNETWRRRYIEYDELTAESVGGTFYVMTALAATIAVFGLLLDSAAVIIGAMLVAPLMTPILGVALGMARGDFPVIRRKLIEVGLGALTAVLFAAVLSFAVPNFRITDEIVARTAPNLFDLAVAVVSGVAGAYAFAHKDMSASLPGVAIAAALVPPLAVLGLGLGEFDFSLVIGAGVLFLANLIAIIIAGCLTFIAVGYFPRTGKHQKKRRRKALVVTGIALIIVAIPMTYFMVDNILTVNRNHRINNAIEKNFPAEEGFSAFETGFEGINGKERLVITFTGISPPPDERVERLTAELQKIAGDDTEIEIRFLPYYSFKDGRWD